MPFYELSMDPERILYFKRYAGMFGIKVPYPLIKTFSLIKTMLCDRHVARFFPKPIEVKKCIV